MAGSPDAEPAACTWDGVAVRYVDARRLPHELAFSVATTVDAVVSAIQTAGVLGAESVDVFGAFGVALAARDLDSDAAFAGAVERIRAVAGPRNRCSAIDRVAGVARAAALTEALRCSEDMRRVNRALAANAAELLPHAGFVLTHGNTGPLAMAGCGTALGAITLAHASGKALHVLIGEGRPLLTGARVSAFSLRRAAVPVTLFPDAAAAWIVRTTPIAAVLVGAWGIAANGDVLGDIGTYGIALAAAQYGVPVYVAASRATVDPSLPCFDADAVPLGPADEVRAFAGRPIAPGDVAVRNPQSDVTPGHLITAIITEYGATRPPYDESVANLMTRPNFALIGSRDDDASGGRV